MSTFPIDRVRREFPALSGTRDGICVWSGHNYALEVVRHLGIEEAAGVVRIGLAHYNTEKEVDRTLAALGEALK